MVVSWLGIKLERAEERLFAFVIGSGVLSLAVFLLAALGLTRPVSFLALGLIFLALGVWFEIRQAGQGSRRGPECGPEVVPLSWKLLFWVLVLPFTALYLAQALGPEYSPDGSSYHLGYVARYLRQGGFGRITTSIFANLSQGLEMLFLFAFAFGRHSAAALVHFAFLAALIGGMLCYARRFGFPGAGIGAALLIYMSPVFGFDGTAAYNDVAAGCVVFYLFYLLEIWDERREQALLVAAGLLAGFAYAIKYTAFVAVIYALGYVLWRSRRARPAAVVALCAAIMIVPWMAKDWVTVSNPFSPFLNRWFPNPYTNVALEQDVAHGNGMLRDGFTLAGSITDMTIHGGLSRSLLGPVFLLAPLALLSLKRRTGRRLLAAAGVFALLWPANVDTRFLIPAAPFLALALGLVLAPVRWAIPVVVLAHAYVSWPTITQRYCDPLALRVRHFLPSEALRVVPEEATLAYRLPGYKVARMIERLVPPQGRVFAFSTPPQAYTSRDVLVYFESSFNQAVQDVLLMPLRPETQPLARWRFDFPRRSLLAVRVTQDGQDPATQWSVGELHVFDAGRELPRAPGWKPRARPNPWDAEWAFDRNPLTRWRSLEPLAPGMHFDVEFGDPLEVDAVALDCANDQWKMRVRLEGEDAAGHWKLLAAAAQRSETAAPADLRAAAIREIAGRGITHILLRDADFGAADFRERTAEWGLRMAGEAEGWRLYAVR